MSKSDKSTTQQFDDPTAAGHAAEEAQPAAAGQGTTLSPEEPPVDATPAPEEPVGEEKKRPISARKLAANRANAQRSTGPRTAEGKAKSRLNAVTHGLTARFFPGVIQVGIAQWREFDAVLTDLRDYYQPQGALEELLLEKVTIEYIRYRRLVEREHSLCVDNPGAAFLEIVNKLARYQTAINNQLFEAIRELERRQAQRKEQEANDREAEGSVDPSLQNEPTVHG